MFRACNKMKTWLRWTASPCIGDALHCIACFELLVQLVLARSRANGLILLQALNSHCEHSEAISFAHETSRSLHPSGSR